MPDQGLKTITIDDLVSELSKSPQGGANSGQDMTKTNMSAPSSNQSRPPAPSPNPTGRVEPRPPIGQQAQSKINTPVPPVPQKTQSPQQVIDKSNPVQTQAGAQPPKPNVQQPKPSQPVSQYQSSIRTMSSDLTNLKSGQQLSGVQIPRKVEEKPSQITAQGISPADNTQANRTNLGPQAVIKVGEMRKSDTLNSPKPSPQIKSSQNSGQSGPSSIIVPEPTRKSRKLILIGLPIILILAISAYWFFAIRDTGDVALTPTASPTTSSYPSPTPEVKFSNIFSGQTNDYKLPDKGDSFSFFLTKIESEKIASGSLEKTDVEIMVASQSVKLNPADMLGKYLISYPEQIKSVLSEKDSQLLVYGQKEHFDTKGKLVPNSKTDTRLVIISEAKSTSSTQGAMSSWEQTMPEDLSSIFGLNYKKGSAVTFSDNIYNGIKIRYSNFNYPDRSIDYAIVTASNKKNYLVITNSRESMYATINALKKTK